MSSLRLWWKPTPACTVRLKKNYTHTHIHPVNKKLRPLCRASGEVLKSMPCWIPRIAQEAWLKKQREIWPNTQHNETRACQQRPGVQQRWESLVFHIIHFNIFSPKNSIICSVKILFFPGTTRTGQTVWQTEKRDLDTRKYLKYNHSAALMTGCSCLFWSTTTAPPWPKNDLGTPGCATGLSTCQVG